MDINDKKFTRTRTIINWVIAIVLAGFLIGLSNIVIYDLDGAISSPSRYDYVNSELENKYKEERNEVDKQMEALNESQQNIRTMVDIANRNKEAEQESFDNWIKTRSTLGKADQDPEVLRRIAKIDEYKEIVSSWLAQSDSIETLKKPLQAKYSEISVGENEESKRVEQLFLSDLKSYEMNVFLIRLLFVAPILALGIFFFLKKRRHKFSPLFMGFTIFSVYVFFVGLVPYLPSYGGYLRYTVGILLTIGLGYYAIKRLRVYQERKSAELKASTEERASKMESERAEKAFNNHICPSCGKDFLLKPWEGLNISTPITKAPVGSNYCRYCGMELSKTCDKCEQKNYAHLPFCINCGEKLK